MNNFGFIIGLGFLVLAIIVAIGFGSFILRELKKQKASPPRPTTPPLTVIHSTASTTSTPEPKLEPVDNATLYRRRIMTSAEAKFQDFLKTTIGPGYDIETRKPLKEIFTRYGWLQKELYTMHNRGHVDFLVVEPQTKNPLFGIELDDWTHKDPKRQDADRRKEELFQRAHMKLLRFQVGKDWGEDDRQLIRENLPKTNL